MPVRIEKQDRVTTVILDNPQVKNAVDPQTASELADAFREFDADAGADVAVLWGDHGCFCAGANLKRISESGVRSSPFAYEGDGPMGPSRMALSKPVIAAIAGYAVAGGLELAIWCDMRVMEEDAVIGVFCRRFGVPLIDGGTVRLPRLIGMGHALDMILTGRGVRADEALQMGLANRVAPKGKSREIAEQLAAEIASFPQVTMRNDRQSAYQQWSLEFDDAMRHELERGNDSLASGAATEGAKRFAGGEGRHRQFG